MVRKIYVDVGKQGERGEAKVNSGQTRLRTRWRGDERKKKSEKKREGGRSLNLPYHLYN